MRSASLRFLTSIDFFIACHPRHYYILSENTSKRLTERSPLPPAPLVPGRIFGGFGDQFVLPAIFFQDRRPELLRVRIEHKVDARGMGHPGVAFHFFFELAGTPACVA